MPYNTAMPNANILGPRLRRIGRGNAPPHTLTKSQTQYYNRGVSTFAALRRANPKRKPLTHSQYYNAGVLTAYGKVAEAHLQLGDLFNDVMGAIVPGWDQRPDVLKKIVVKPDPTKLIQIAQKVAPNAAGQIVGAANANGLNVMVKTPVGLMPLSQAMAQGLYSNAGIITQAQTALESVPTWVWAAGAGGLILLLATMRR